MGGTYGWTGGHASSSALDEAGQPSKVQGLLLALACVRRGATARLRFPPDTAPITAIAQSPSKYRWEGASCMATLGAQRSSWWAGMFA